MTSEAKAWERMQKAIWQGIQEDAAFDAQPIRIHSESCAYHFGGDCTCGLIAWSEDEA